MSPLEACRKARVFKDHENRLGFPSGTDLLGGTAVKINYTGKFKEPFSFNIKEIPPKMSVPIKLTLSVTAKWWLQIQNCTLHFHTVSGSELSCKLSDISDNADDNEHHTGTSTCLIPANTEIADNMVTLTANAGTYISIGTIDKIIATY